MMAISGRPVEHEPTPDGEASEWRSLYDIEDAGEVEAFVARFPGLPELLAQVPRELQARFESNERPRLRVTWELDSPDDPLDAWLTIELPTDRDWQDARDRLQRFDDEWWLDAMPRGEPLIAILPRHR